jgi:hypothetical protein
LEAGSGVELYGSDEGSRGDWALIDPAAAMDRYEQQQARAETGAEAAPAHIQDEMSRISSEQDKLRESVEHLQQQVQEQGTTQPQRSVTAVETAPTAAAAAGGPAGSTSTLKERLRVLKDLRDQDLISEEIYKARVEKLLDENL